MVRKSETKLNPTLEFTYEQKVFLRDYSIERFLNTAIQVGFKWQSRDENASTLQQDAQDLKPILEYIWANLQNELHKQT